MNWYWYLNQDEYWYPNGKARIQIEKMDERWRRNAANCLIRWSPNLVFQYQMCEHEWLITGMGGQWREVIGEDEDHQPIAGGLANMLPRGEMAMDAYERSQEKAIEHPEEWIRCTDLYKALLKGL